MNRFRRFWPLLAVAVLGVAAFKGLRTLQRLRNRVRPVANALAAPLARTGREAVATPPDANERLRQELVVMRLEYAALRERLKREELRGAHLRFEHQRLAKLEPCALLFRDPATWFRSCVLDVGAAEGVRDEAGVLTADGVVGKLDQLGQDSSSLLLLSDPTCRFSARLARTGLQCSVRGDGRRGCLLEHLGGQDDVRVGDVVETGAGGRSFPHGVPVGRVVRLERLEGGLRLEAEVEPAANLSRLEGLYVWVGEPKP